MDDKKARRGEVGKRDQDRRGGFPNLAESELGPGHCPNCGGVDFFELNERGEWFVVCADCGRRVLGSA